MRIDLTANFLAEMSKEGRQPIQLMVVHFETGDVYLSDRDITIGGQLYEGIVEEWGDLTTVGYEQSESSTLELAVTLWNGGTRPFSNYFYIEDPVNVFVDLYQTFEGLPPEDIAHIGEFVLQDPITLSEASLLLELDLVSTNMRYYGQVGPLLLKKDYPNALEADLNKSIDLIVGNAGRVQCLCSDKPPTATLDGSVLKGTINFHCREDLIQAGFPYAGLLQIGEEKVRYNYRTGDFFQVVQRGYDNTPIQTHGDGAVLIQLDSVQYIIGQGPLSSVSGVQVGGQTPTVNYTIQAAANPATITFTSQPTFTELTNLVTDNAYFDDVSGANNAIQPHYAFWQEYASEGAQIKPGNNTLALIQSDVIQDFGEIVNIFLSVTHWSTEPYLSDYARVWLNDPAVGDIGRLSRPNEQDTIDVSGEIDIDHPHTHETGGTHSHGSLDPAFSSVEGTVNTLNDGHLHSQTATANRLKLSNPTTADGGDHSAVFVGERLVYLDRQYFYDVSPKVLSAVVTTTLQNDGDKNSNAGNYGVDIYVQRWFRDIQIETVTIMEDGFFDDGETKELTIPFPEWNQNYTSVQCSIRVVVRHKNESGYTRSADYSSVNTMLNYAALVETTDVDRSNVTTKKDSSGKVSNQGIDTTSKPIKDISDVDDLATDNRPLVNVESSKATKSYTELFDITDKLQSVDWSWFSGREARIIYTGGADNVTIYITNIEMVVEYRQRTVKPTDDVTCLPVGSIENRPDAVVQYLLTEKAGVPLEKLSSVYRDVPVWDDANIWDDNDVWLDGGQVGDVPEGAAFEEAAAWFDFHNYLIDGVIPGGLSVKEAIKELTWQTRCKLIWQNGVCQLAVQRISDNWTVNRELDTNDIQLQSFALKKTNVDQIVNRLEIFYTIDRLSSATGREMYDATAAREDLPSIDKHGERVKDDMWLFYLVRSQGMAEHIADYYIWLLGETSTYYNFNAYLKSFDIEKEDYIRINAANWQAVKSLPVVVRELSRLFGSGKLSKINLLRMVGQSIRHTFHSVFENDEIVINDNLTFSFDLDHFQDDLISLVDQLLLTWNVAESDTITLSDNFNSFWDIRPSYQDTIQLNSDLAAHLSVELESSFRLTSHLEVAQELCFGACGFGGGDLCQIPFGSRTQWTEQPGEDLFFMDELNFNINPGLLSDIVIEDNLIFSDGFGCPAGLGEGMGLSPFGC